MNQEEKPSVVRHDEIAPYTQPAEENRRQTKEDQEVRSYCHTDVHLLMCRN